MPRTKGARQPIRNQECRHCGVRFQARGGGYCEARCLISSNIEILEDGCWRWTGSLARRGYGSAWNRKNGKDQLAHRMSYEAFVGPIKSGMLACHQCDRPDCVNFGHIFIGTQSENIRDAHSKGRIPGSLKGGEKNIRSKLSLSEVEKIRLDSRSQKIIAAHFRINQSQVSRIKSGNRWGA